MFFSDDESAEQDRQRRIKPSSKESSPKKDPHPHHLSADKPAPFASPAVHPGGDIPSPLPIELTECVYRCREHSCAEQLLDSFRIDATFHSASQDDLTAAAGASSGQYGASDSTVPRQP